MNDFKFSAGVFCRSGVSGITLAAGLVINPVVMAHSGQAAKRRSKPSTAIINGQEQQGATEAMSNRRAGRPRTKRSRRGSKAKLKRGFEKKALREFDKVARAGRSHAASAQVSGRRKIG